MAEDWRHERDPGLTLSAVRAGATLARAQSTVLPAVATAMNEYLKAVTVAVLGPSYRAPSYLVAAAGDEPTPPDMDAWPPETVWVAAFDKHVVPALNRVFGEAFAAVSRTATLSDRAAWLSYLTNVHDRLSARLWTPGVFEEARYELLEGLSEGESVTQLRDRVGAVTNIDAYSRVVRADIRHYRTVVETSTDPAEVAQARTRLRGLYASADDADTQWHYQARRVARTETMGAVNGGQWAGALSRAEATGTTMYKQWIATDDARTRPEHVSADGQVQPLASPFLVGGAPLQHPGEAGGPAHLVINCRCTLIYLDEGEAARAGYQPGQDASIVG